MPAFLGKDRESWLAWDTVTLIAEATERLPLLVDQGGADEFMASQLRPDLLEEACKRAHHPLTLRRHEGYDHSYYLIASFLSDHLDHHAQSLFT